MSEALEELRLAVEVAHVTAKRNARQAHEAWDDISHSVRAGRKLTDVYRSNWIAVERIAIDSADKLKAARKAFREALLR